MINLFFGYNFLSALFYGAFAARCEYQKLYFNTAQMNQFTI